MQPQEPVHERLPEVYDIPAQDLELLVRAYPRILPALRSYAWHVEALSKEGQDEIVRPRAGINWTLALVCGVVLAAVGCVFMWIAGVSGMTR